MPWEAWFAFVWPNHTFLSLSEVIQILIQLQLCFVAEAIGYLYAILPGKHFLLKRLKWCEWPLAAFRKASELKYSSSNLFCIWKTQPKCLTGRRLLTFLLWDCCNGFVSTSTAAFLERYTLVLQIAPNEITQNKLLYQQLSPEMSWAERTENNFKNRILIAWIWDSEIPSSYHVYA